MLEAAPCGGKSRAMSPQTKYRAPADPEEFAARIRAARAWARLTQPELAERLGRSKSTVERMEKGDPAALGGGSVPKISRLQLEVAQATGVPSVFFLALWDYEEEKRQERHKAEQLEQLERAAGARLEQRLARIEEALGLNPGPRLDAVEEGLEGAFDEGEQQGAGRSAAPASRREADSRGR